ncbi:MAG: TIGR01212 family radical SAM protein [Anaeroplasmataceae bacterium]
MNKEKRYNTLTEYYKYKFNNKVCKISLNANFTCPNKDGKFGYGGCSFCSKLGSGDFAGDKNKPLKEQFEDIVKTMEKKWPNALYIPYLQANSNTYASLDVLKKIYEEVITYSDKIVMLSIATRPDCLEDEKIEYLALLNKKIPVQIELGLQSIWEETTKLTNRCHSLECLTNCVKKLRANNIEVVLHIINGLPYENKEMMLKTIEYVNTLDIQGIKIHSLVILKDTKMGNDYLKNPWPILTLDEYTDIVVSQIRHLNPNIIIHRLAADGAKEDLIAPTWTIKKMVVMNEIDKKMRALDAYQGDSIKATH